MKTVEIYGFVGWVSSFILFIVFVIWSFFPDEILNKYGISYYPDKRWALTIPSIIVMGFVYFQIFVVGSNMLITKKLSSFYNLEGKCATDCFPLPSSTKPTKNK